ncbi:MAG TPA: methyltransferase domain-containing protein [Acidiphilium sp.]|jgi:SAM-dependent methyltransferase|uniref:methyltransferase domain-containing protein n=1 Tax=unclassified Acidiphilium TaxID=2617493 RepID=UPI00191812F3|nr:MULTISPECIES: methyltransferase domain-containing protein [unclassified Acidiphilium]HQT62242.1 methyltransferase domain-containing protein [Acidiphilium sp.]HQU11278.1 methyltransferase domain-containing protein [Acidiphilium sp.]
MIDLSRRQMLPEVMDDPELDPAIYRRCLADLARVNRVTMTHRATLAWLDRALRAGPGGRTFTLLDLASGHGDKLRAIAALAARRGWRAELIGVDLNPRATAAAMAATPPDAPIRYVTADALRYTPPTPPDFIVSSQFTHHLADAEVIELLGRVAAMARQGWLIADLHRHAVPYYGFRWLARLAGWHEIVRRDGTASIARGFTRRDWQACLDAAGVRARIDWTLPFRHLVSSLP